MKLPVLPTLILATLLSSSAYAVDVSGISNQDRRDAVQALTVMKADTNADGVIDEAEFLALSVARFETLDADNTGDVGVTLNGVNTISTLDDLRHYKKKRFNHVDLNADQKLTEAEFLASATEIFISMDIDGNGLIDIIEAKDIANAYKRQRLIKRNEIIEANNGISTLEQGGRKANVNANIGGNKIAFNKPRLSNREILEKHRAERKLKREARKAKRAASRKR